MTDLDVQQRLASALSELPGGSVVVPVGLGEQAARRERRRRRLLVAASAVAVLGLAGGVNVVVGGPDDAPLTDVAAEGTPTAGPPTPFSLEGTREEPRPFKQLALRPGQVPQVLATTDVTPVEDDQASVPWTFNGTRQDDRVLSLSYNPSCGGAGQVQVAETPDYVLVQIVRTGPASSLGCLLIIGGEVTLDAPVGARRLLHAATREVLPSKAYTRRPDLPGGVSELPDRQDSATTYDLGDEQVLTFVTGRRHTHARDADPTWVAGHPATFSEMPDGLVLAWEEDGVPLFAVLSSRPGSEGIVPTTSRDRSLLRRVAESSYAREYVGLTEDAARALATTYGLDFRVFKDDRGTAYTLADLSFARVSVELRGGKVAGARFS